MKKLSKSQVEERGRHMAKLEETQVALEQAIAAYKAALVEAQQFCAGVAEEIRAYFDDKSEKWQEGERGQAYEEWATGWEGVEFPEVDEPSEQAAEVLGALEEEPAS